MKVATVALAFVAASLTGEADAVQLIGVSQGTANGSDPIDMARVCQASFVGSRACTSEDLRRAASVAGAPSPGATAQAFFFLPTPRAAVYANPNIMVVDDLGMTYSAGDQVPPCGVYTLATNGLGSYQASTGNVCTLFVKQVLCCSDQ